jgi:hypothetical protein
VIASRIVSDAATGCSKTKNQVKDCFAPAYDVGSNKGNLAATVTDDCTKSGNDGTLKLKSVMQSRLMKSCKY